jgi:hypothetical protein
MRLDTLISILTPLSPGVALGVAAVELVIVLFACCLGRRMGLTSQYV